ncbi:hypothetical protein [Clostridioides difficile]|uniref:hypothetical protein n=1 Tax=Clostridioides difficile TaxID=1496 RepID=UPI001034F8BE|nr:hypothetical protein [Clostridioides difficile]HCQ6058026.1 hypothetical protein [Clostridioides difficile]
MLNEEVVKKIKNVPSDTNNAIEIVRTELSNKIGDTTQLTTTNKTNIVSALNEVKTSVDSIETTADKTSIKDTDNLFESDNVEGALKEVMQEVKGNRSSIISTINNNLIPM